MIRFFIRNFTIISGSIYSFYHLLNIRPPKKRTILCSAFFSLLLCVISYVIFPGTSYISLLLQIYLCVLFLMFITKTSPELTLTVTILSYGISYCCYMVSASISSIILGLCGLTSDMGLIYLQLPSCILQALILWRLYKIPRLRNGIPFGDDITSNNIAVITSVMVLFAIIIFSTNDKSLIYILPLLLIFFCTILIYIWWKYRVSKNYMERVKQNEIASLRERIEVLEKENLELAKIIHKDNKMIPSMKLAVCDFIKSFDNPPEGSDELLDMLDSMYNERYGAVISHEISTKKLPPTQVASIDSMLKFMVQKASLHMVNLDLTLSASLKYLVETTITEDDLRTIMADLTENAIIATEYSHKRNIFIHVYIEDNHYIIDFYDSGIPFTQEVLANFGKKQITTHADTGGSGIGLINTAEILHRYKASIMVTKFDEPDNPYTKRISLIFDEKDACIIK